MKEIANLSLLEKIVAIFDVYDDDLLSLLEDVDSATKRLQEIGEFTATDLDRLKRAFLPDRISDTLNIESIQVNPRLTQAILEGLTVSDTDKYAEQAILNVNEANLFIENAAKSNDILSLRHVSEINRLIEVGMGESKEPGRTRQIDVRITGSSHEPPHWADVPDILRSGLAEVEQSNSHPVAKACFGHWLISHVHPFENGNGRTARLIQDLLLIRSGLLPVGIPIGRRSDYYDALSEADQGNGIPLVRIVAAAELSALDKAFQVGSEEKASRSRVKQLLAQANTRVENLDFQKYEFWSRKVDVLLAEITRRLDQWNDDDGKIQFKYFIEEKPNFQKWTEIKKEGWAPQTHLCKIEVRQGREIILKALWYAKRHRLDFVIGDNSELAQEVGIYLALAHPQDRFLVIEPLRDPYVQLREVLPWNSGFRILTETDLNESQNEREGVRYEFFRPAWHMDEVATLGRYLDDFLEQLLRKCGLVE